MYYILSILPRYLNDENRRASMSEYVVLVDEKDVEIGQEEKLQAHVNGVLHRAFSVFIFDAAGRLLLQKRHPAKYHSGGLWSNTCCSHPRPGEPVEEAAQRRLGEEMGITCELQRLFGFVYKSRLGDLYEHEYDHVFVGHYDGDPEPDEQEVAAWRWVRPEDLSADMVHHPEQYTYWFKYILGRVLQHKRAA